jgi:uncharacterized RDD family membrane protein YckC
MSGAGFEIVCNGCRSTVASDAAACPACGIPLWGPRRAAPAPAVVRAAPALEPMQPVFAASSGGLSPSGYAVAAARQAIAAGSYGGFWIRAVAFVIDAILTGIVLAAVFVMAGRGPAILASIGVGLLYHPLMESSGSRGTLGKIFCGLTVADLSGRRIGFSRAFVRNLARILDVLTLDIGYMMAGWTRRKQALHDFVAQTIVLRQ